MSPALQAKLLRVLQEGVFSPLGSVSERRADVRIIAATNRDLAELAEKGQFRSDLYYRLDVVTINLPRLRERREDIPLLVEHFLRKHGARPGVGFTKEAMDLLICYPWPGNVRELENEVRRTLVIAAERGVFGSETLSPRIIRPDASTQAPQLAQTLKQAVGVMERELIERSLAKNGGNRTRAARELGMSRSTLIEKIELYGFAETVSIKRRAGEEQ
jgi:transcriptional regulator with PAS, ATPase and Fis domain